ncbi:MAG TPA: hypothetical protein VNU01_08480, partial [Egibacteraceae bacterium]|nr:hypothetical protein [Egibacteraceae bacterium]
EQRDLALELRRQRAVGPAHHGVDVEIEWVPADDLSDADAAERALRGVHGVLVPGGFGVRGIDGKINAARFARERDTPYLGICLGLQVAVVEFARHVLGLAEANSSEFDPHTPDPVVDLMADQRDVTDMGGTMRLGLYPAKLVQGTRAAAAYGEPVVYERHRHRWEVNNRYRPRLAEAGMAFSGLSPDDRLVEFVEIPGHPWFVATQAHPEFRSRPNRPHPLFRDFVGAARERMLAQAGRLPEPSARAEAEPSARAEPEPSARAEVEASARIVVDATETAPAP